MVKDKFSKGWVKSIKPCKQRKYRYNAPLHIKHRFMSVHLSKDLRSKHKIRRIIVKTGDSVMVLKGQFKKKVGKVASVDIRKSKVFIEGIESVKKDGTKSLYPFTPSNLLITELNLDDKKRLKVSKNEKTS